MFSAECVCLRTFLFSDLTRLSYSHEHMHYYYYYYYYYYKCHGLDCYHHSCGGTLQKSRFKTVAQLNADVC